MSVTMPALPNNKQETRREVFVSLVQSPAVGVQIERNWHKLIVLTLRFVIISPAPSLDRSECNYLVQ